MRRRPATLIRPLGGPPDASRSMTTLCLPLCMRTSCAAGGDPASWSHHELSALHGPLQPRLGVLDGCARPDQVPCGPALLHHIVAAGRPRDPAQVGGHPVELVQHRVELVLSAPWRVEPRQVAAGLPPAPPPPAAGGPPPAPVRAP